MWLPSITRWLLCKGCYQGFRRLKFRTRLNCNQGTEEPWSHVTIIELSITEYHSLLYLPPPNLRGLHPLNITVIHTDTLNRMRMPIDGSLKMVTLQNSSRPWTMMMRMRQMTSRGILPRTRPTSSTFLVNCTNARQKPMTI